MPPVFNLCAKFDLDISYRSRIDYNFPVTAILTFYFYDFRDKGGTFQISSNCSSLAGTTDNDVLRVGICPKMRPVGVTKKGKKDRNLHASNWLFAHTTNVDVSP